MRYLIIFILLSIGSILFGQDQFDVKKYNIEKEAILNKVINSIEFDSVYLRKKVLVKANDLLSKSSDLKLKKKRCKVKIKKQIKDKQYVVLGDFTMPRNDPKSVRVQLEILPDETLLNMRLEKINGTWQIVNHLILRN